MSLQQYVFFSFQQNSTFPFFSLSTGLGICCSAVESIKDRKPGKHCSISSSFQSFSYVAYLLRNWQAFCNQGFNLLNVSTANVASHPNQIESQLGYRLCTDDTKLKALEICLLYPV